jgi:hypothetical protein
MVGLHIEFLSEWRCLLGIFYQKGSEIIDGKEKMFTEVAIGIVFIYIRIAKYKKGEN